MHAQESAATRVPRRIGGRFIQYYREHAKYKERTYTFVERIGIAKLRAIIVDDSEGLADALDRAMHESAEATYDPWRERDQPMTPNQFSDLLMSED